MTADSILWDSGESDRFTERARDLHEGELVELDVKRSFAGRVKNALDEAGVRPDNLVEVGCAYGANLHHLGLAYPGATLAGIDPGDNSIATARANCVSDRIRFETGHAHALPLDDGSADVMIYSMVLQWIPRSLMTASLTEIDRVLRPGGAVVIYEFLPDAPLRSVSRHNPEVLIFKEDYARRFASPEYDEVVRRVTRGDEGPDHRSVLSVLKRLELESAWPLHEAAREDRAR